MAKERDRGLEVDGPCLKAVRIMKNMSLEEVAGAEISVTTLKNMEKGGFFDENSCNQVAKRLAVPVAVFLVGYFAEMLASGPPVLVIEVNDSPSDQHLASKVLSIIEGLKIQCFLKSVPIVVRYASGSMLLTLQFGSFLDAARVVMSFCAATLPMRITAIEFARNNEKLMYIAFSRLLGHTSRLQELEDNEWHFADAMKARKEREAQEFLFEARIVEDRCRVEMLAMRQTKTRSGKRAIQD